jgi:ubiquinone/menaquinone biosynthesis C-methylase UbiE
MHDMSMSTPRFYHQSGLLVTAYDALHPPDMAGSPIEGDVGFYRSLAAEQGGPVLELACGTGRIALALAADGFDMVGVDRSRPMLAIAEAKRRVAGAGATRVEFVEGDMRTVELGRTFGLAIIAFRSFASLLTVDDQRRCLSTVWRHLDSRGVLVLDLFDPRLDLCLPDPPDDYPHSRGRALLPDTGTTVEAEVTARHNDPLTQVLTETWRHTERASDGSILRQELDELVLRWTYRYELHHLLGLSRFDLVAEYSDFGKSPPAYGHELVIVARRRDGGDE